MTNSITDDQLLLVAEQQRDDTLIDAEICAGLFVVTENGVRRDSFEEYADAVEFANKLRIRNHNRIQVLPKFVS